jgi:crooked neck
MLVYYSIFSHYFCFQPPKQKISDPDELADYQHRKRRAFEDSLRKNRTVISNWIKYAQWEESQKEVPRYRQI